MTNPLDDTEACYRVIEELAGVLVRHLGILPDVALVMRVGEQCRTLFAANPANPIPNENFRVTLGSMLEQAVEQNLRRREVH